MITSLREGNGILNDFIYGINFKKTLTAVIYSFIYL